MQADGSGVRRLLEVMRKLRGPGGCPWDREQSLKSLKPCLLEECHELLEVMDGGGEGEHVEELGDVLLQVVFQAAIREEEGAFSFDDVVEGITEKLVRRHPHVFGSVEAETSSEVLRNWEEIKRGERSGEPERSALAGVPMALPALLKAQRVQSKAARVGFDWPDASGPVSKIGEELAELEEAVAVGDQGGIEEEVGDLLFSVVNYCRFLKVDAEGALEGTIGKFMRRFAGVEAEVRRQEREMSECTLEELDEIWERVKHLDG